MSCTINSLNVDHLLKDLKGPSGLEEALKGFDSLEEKMSSASCVTELIELSYRDLSELWEEASYQARVDTFTQSFYANFCNLIKKEDCHELFLEGDLSSPFMSLLLSLVNSEDLKLSINLRQSFLEDLDFLKFAGRLEGLQFCSLKELNICGLCMQKGTLDLLRRLAQEKDFKLIEKELPLSSEET